MAGYGIIFGKEERSYQQGFSSAQGKYLHGWQRV
jgi:hypothetical protein